MAYHAPRRRERGFTLLEILLVILIVGIVSAVTGSMLDSGFRAYFVGSDLAGIDWQARLGTGRLARDLRSVRSASAADLTMSPSGDQISFVNRDGATVSYWLNGTTLMRNSQPLADGVTALSFSYLTNNARSVATTEAEVFYITADLTVAGDHASRSLRVTVFPRAF